MLRYGSSAVGSLKEKENVSAVSEFQRRGGCCYCCFCCCDWRFWPGGAHLQAAGGGKSERKTEENPSDPAVSERTSWLKLCGATGAAAPHESTSPTNPHVSPRAHAATNAPKTFAMAIALTHYPQGGSNWRKENRKAFHGNSESASAPRAFTLAVCYCWGLCVFKWAGISISL